jgi:inosose dehydratase
VLAERELTLIGAFVPVDFSDRAAHEAGVETALRTGELLAEAAGSTPLLILADENGKRSIRTENAGRIQAEHGLSSAKWGVFTQGVERVATEVRDQVGLRTVFHHHCAGFVETPGEIDSLLRRTDPQLVGLCLDTGHCRFGGGDPLRLLATHGPRIWHVHFKDHDPSVAAEARAQERDYFAALRQGVFCELGRGDVDFPSVRDALEQLGYRGWIVVEQDVLPNTGSPLESARANRSYLREIGL